MEYIDLDKSSVPPNAVNLIPDDLMRKHLILPLGKENGKLRVAIHDPLDLEMLDILRFRLNKELRTVLAPKGRIKSYPRRAVQHHRPEHDRQDDGQDDRPPGDSLDKSLDKSMDKSLDRSIDKSIDIGGMGEDDAERPDAGADHQAGAGDDRRGRAQPRVAIFTSSR